MVDNNIDNWDDMKIVLSHELFHHYQEYICGDNDKTGNCLSGQFMTDATADLLSYYYNSQNINKYNTLLNGHAEDGVRYSYEPVDKAIEDPCGIGYRTFTFAYNYVSVVENGNKVLFESMKTTEPLKYLYNNSSGNYKKSLLLTAERNLTLDYENKLLIPMYEDKLYYPKNYKELGTINNKENTSIDYSSMHYYYINSKEYEENSQLSFNGSSDDLSLLFFIKENDSYKYLYTHTLNKEFTINVNEFRDYQEIVFAIVNSEISGVLSYSHELNNNGTKEVTVTPESLNLTPLEETLENISSITCYTLEEDEEYKTVYQIKVMFDKKDKVSDFYAKGSIQIKNYDPDDPIFVLSKKITSGLIYAMQQAYKESFKYYKIMTNDLDDTYSFTIKATKDFYNALKNNFDVISESKSDILKSIKQEGFKCKYKK